MPNYGEYSGADGQTGSFGGIYPGIPVEKPVESVNNFLYILGEHRRNVAKAGRRTELFSWIPCFYHLFQEGVPSKCAFLRDFWGLTTWYALLK